MSMVRSWPAVQGLLASCARAEGISQRRMLEDKRRGSEAAARARRRAAYRLTAWGFAAPRVALFLGVARANVGRLAREGAEIESARGGAEDSA